MLAMTEMGMHLRIGFNETLNAMHADFVPDREIMPDTGRSSNEAIYLGGNQR